MTPRMVQTSTESDGINAVNSGVKVTLFPPLSVSSEDSWSNMTVDKNGPKPCIRRLVRLPQVVGGLGLPYHSTTCMM